MLLTNIGLVTHATIALNQKWGYVRGTFGQVLTEAIYKAKLKQLGYEAVGKFEDFILKNWLGKRTVDCVGLIKSYLWWQDDDDVEYTPSSDKNADGMFDLARVKGPIDTIPEVIGLGVYKKGHIGIYIGRGKVIESRGTLKGVIQSPLTGSGSAGWTNWMELPYITYIKEDTKKDWKKILSEVSENGSEWEEAINTAVNAANAEGALGPLEIFKFLPALIEKVYYHKN